MGRGWGWQRARVAPAATCSCRGRARHTARASARARGAPRQPAGPRPPLPSFPPPLGWAASPSNSGARLLALGRGAGSGVRGPAVAVAVAVGGVGWGRGGARDGVHEVLRARGARTDRVGGRAQGAHEGGGAWREARDRLTLSAPAPRRARAAAPPTTTLTPPHPTHHLPFGSLALAAEQPSLRLRTTAVRPQAAAAHVPRATALRRDPTEVFGLGARARSLPASPLRPLCGRRHRHARHASARVARHACVRVREIGGDC